LILRKLRSYPRHNGLALARLESGGIAHTLFVLDWLLEPQRRRP
jgi:TnpA family transposase